MLNAIKDLVLPFVESAPVIRAILAAVLLFFLPGFAWTLVFFSNGRQINIAERLVLSFGLSIALVTLSILALNILIDVSITGTNTLITITAITVIPAVWYFILRIYRKRR